MKIISLILLLLPLVLNGQSDLYKNYLGSVVSNDSKHYELRDSLIYKTNSKDTLDAIELIEVIHQKYIGGTEDQSLNKQSTNVSDESFGLIYQILSKAFINKDFYFFASKELITLSDKLGMKENHFFSIISYGSMAMMTGDTLKIKETIDYIDNYPDKQDSAKLCRKYLYLSELHKITKAESPIKYYEKFEHELVNHLNIQIDSSVYVGGLRAYANYLIQKGDLYQAAQKLLKVKNYFPNNKIFSLPRIETYLELSQIYLDLKNQKLAEKYLNQAIKVCDNEGYQKFRDTRCVDQRAKILARSGQYNKVIDLLEGSIKQYGKISINESLTKQMLVHLGDAYLNENKMPLAKESLNKASAIKVKNSGINAANELLKANYLFHSGMHKEAIDIGLSNLKFCVEENLVSQKPSNLFLLYQIYNANGNKSEALKYHEQYHALDDSLYQSGQQLGISELQTEYEVGIREEQIKTLNAKNSLTSTELKAQKTISVISAFGLILLSYFLYNQYNLYNKLKLQNELIIKSNEEKNVLLKEIHHRVKNNLQVISSLLKLQSRYIKDDNAVRAIAEGRARVQSMALLHQNLYQDDNLKGVNIEEYFSNLIQGLFDAYNIEEDTITLKVDIDPLILDVDTVIPLGLISNELISNALKHAFHGIENGELFVSLKEREDKLILIVKDNGVGKSKKIKPESGGGFGKMLIQSLSSKLEAEIHETQNNGTTVKIVIHDYKVAA